MPPRPPRPHLPLLVHLLLPILMLAFGAAQLVATDPTEYTLREWHEQDGLPSDEMTGVIQDEQGFLWVASSGGLARFDGTAFEPAEVPAGGFTRGMTLIPGSAGKPTLLTFPGTAPTTTRAAGSYQLRDGTFRFEAEPALAGKTIQVIFTAKDSSLWFGCEDGTVLRRNGAESRVFEPPANPGTRKVTAFATDKDGQLWVLRGNRLARVQDGQLAEIAFARPEPELRVASSTTGGIWVFTRNTLLRWTGTALEEVLRLPDLRGAHFIQTALEDSHGYLWIGTRSQGLFRINGRDILPVPTSSEYLVALCEDTEGNLWAATNGGGLSRLRAKAHQIIDQSNGLKDNFSYTVAEDATGTIWLANRDGGPVRYSQGTIDRVSAQPGWPTFSAMSVYPTADGKVWVTSGIGVFRTDAAAPKKAERIAALSHLRSVRATFVASNGDFWLASDPDRIVRWRNDQVTTFGPAEGFDGHEPRAFAEDAQGRLWVGAADGRLFRTHGERFEPVPFPDAENCRSLQVIRFEPDGTIYVGTTRQGVVIFPKGDIAHPRILNSSHGLPGNNITQILHDDHDRTWFASRTGVFWIHDTHLREFAAGRIDSVHAVVLGKDDGLPYLSCLGLFQPAAWKAHDGTLWFASRRGILRTDPSLVDSNASAPPSVTLASITCDGQNRSLSSLLEIGSPVRKTQLRLSVLNLSAPESVQVRYRLDGFDSDWQILDRTRLAVYPRLPPGRYTLQTMASNGNGTWSSQPALLSLVVTPPWWQNAWAQLAGVLGLAVLVGVVVRQRSHRRLRQRLERSENARIIERERTRIARTIHDELGASLTRISLLTQTAQQQSGAHSPIIEKIYEATRAITRSMDEIVWAVNPEQDHTESLVYYLGNFAQSFLGAAGIRCRLESPDNLPATPLTSQIRHQLFLCCKEALNNLVKHAQASEVTIRITADQTTLAIAIADNGRGMTGLDHVSANPLRADSGQGLNNLRQRMTEVHGTCVITPSPAGGTTVTFTVPLVVPPPV